MPKFSQKSNKDKMEKAIYNCKFLTYLILRENNDNNIVGKMNKRYEMKSKYRWLLNTIRGGQSYA